MGPLPTPRVTEITRKWNDFTTTSVTPPMLQKVQKLKSSELRQSAILYNAMQLE